jgi:hypothetical protein
MTSIAAGARAGVGKPPRREPAGDEAPRCRAVYGDLGGAEEIAEECRRGQAGEPVLSMGLIGARSAGRRMVVIEPAARDVDVAVVVASGGPARVRSSVVAWRCGYVGRSDGRWAAPSLTMVRQALGSSPTAK